MSSEMSVLYVPTRPYAACAGFSSGPNMLRAVRTFGRGELRVKDGA